MKKTETPEEIHPKVITETKWVAKTPDELIANCRIASAQNKPHVFIDGACLKFFIGESPDFGFTMMGVNVIKDGCEKEFYASLGTTNEDVNFPKG